MRYATTGGSDTITAVINRYGTYIRLPYGSDTYGFCPTAPTKFIYFLVGTDTEDEWPLVPETSPSNFYTRIIKGAGFKAHHDAQRTKVIGWNPPCDIPQAGMMAGAMAAGSMGAIGDALASVFQMKMQMDLQREMQAQALKNAMEIQLAKNRTDKEIANARLFSRSGTMGAGYNTSSKTPAGGTSARNTVKMQASDLSPGDAIIRQARGAAAPVNAMKAGGLQRATNQVRLKQATLTNETLTPNPPKQHDPFANTNWAATADPDFIPTSVSTYTPVSAVSLGSSKA